MSSSLFEALAFNRTLLPLLLLVMLVVNPDVLPIAVTRE